MITQTQPKNIVFSQEMETVGFGIDQESLAGIFQVLRSSLYSDGILALLREYATNAMDAHIDSGKPNLPFRVTLPTQLEPTVKIRDFGNGLTNEQIVKIYSMYGKSTKANTNDQTGQLGLGSKSGFAYGDGFSIISYVGGIKTTYEAFIDESLIGQIAKFPETEKTIEADGLEIVIAVKPSDIRSFHMKAAELYSYFTPKPEVVNLFSDYSLERPVAIVSYQNWSILGRGNVSKVVMGNIAYPIDGSAITNITEQQQQILNMGVEIEIKIGDVQMAASREALQYTPYTIRAVKAELEKIVTDLPHAAKIFIAGQPDIWSAKATYSSFIASLGYGVSTKVSAQLKGKVEWKGVMLDDTNFRYNDSKNKGVTITHYYKNWQGQKNFKTNIVDIIVPTSNVGLVINDGNVNSTAKIKHYAETEKKEAVYVIKFENEMARKTFYKATHFATVPFKLMSALPKPVVTNANGVVSSPNKKHTAKCFVWSPTVGGYRQPSSTDWKDATVDYVNGSGVYVIIDRFEVLGAGQTSAGHNSFASYDFKQLLAKLENAGVKIPTISGFKVAMTQDKPIGANWVSFWDWAAKALETELTTKGIVQKISDLAEFDKTDKSTFASLVNHVAKIDKSGSVMTDYLKALDYMLILHKDRDTYSKYTTAQKALNMNLTTKPTYEMEPLYTAITTSYPLLKLLSSYEVSYNTEMVLDYINLKDKN